MNAEQNRLRETELRLHHWRRWGPYLSERQWGTIREDYSADGDAWSYLTHDMSRSFAYRWGEDGLAGWSDNHQRLCFGLALWNGYDPILKERLFGLGNPEGNHGEDVKEYYWYLDATPTHSYMKYRYRYPTARYPYEDLVRINRARHTGIEEYELLDSGIFDDAAFLDVSVEYAKSSPHDTCIRISILHHGNETTDVQILPTLWFRNDWAWNPYSNRPSIAQNGPYHVFAHHEELGDVLLQATIRPQRWLFTENVTNKERLYNGYNESPHVKDAFHRYVVQKETDAVHPSSGTKCAALYHLRVDPGHERHLLFRLSEVVHSPSKTNSAEIENVLRKRKKEADEFYAAVFPDHLTDDQATIARQALAGMMWSKQTYHFVVEDWLNGDPGQPAPPNKRRQGRNATWLHVHNDDVLAMPDVWEYPWYAVWDSAFHAVTHALVDTEFAKHQITSFTREWYMHPNGQFPAYEWSFSDVNPPVHAWAALRVYNMDASRTGHRDKGFLEAVFHKLLMNFTWWVNRKDSDNNNLFEGGFLGMDNIGVFDRNVLPPSGGRLEQSDGTSWMAMYSLNLLSIAWELSKDNIAYEDIASKFFEHFLYIARAMTNMGGRRQSLWHEEDGFFYDQLSLPDGTHLPIRIRSMVGLIPLLAVEILDYNTVGDLEGFHRRMNWFFENRRDLTNNMTCLYDTQQSRRCLLSLVNPDQMRKLLNYLLDEDEFLSSYGIRSLSKIHHEHPYELHLDGVTNKIQYEPGESSTRMFGGNSNWRGPIWLPVNFLLIEALEKLHNFWGDQFIVDCPTGSGNKMNLSDVAKEIRRRLISMFERGLDGRPILAGFDEMSPADLWQSDPLFYEYMNGDTGNGLGASHQTGWTGLIANLLLEQRR